MFCLPLGPIPNFLDSPLNFFHRRVSNLIGYNILHAKIIFLLKLGILLKYFFLDLFRRSVSEQSFDPAGEIFNALGVSTAGEWGSIAIYWWDGIRMRVKVGTIGENGLKPNTKYSLNDAHEFEEVAE